MNFEFTARRREFSCTADLSHELSPIFGSQLISTKPENYRSLLGYQRIDPYTELLWGKHSCLSGVLMPKKVYVFTIQRGGGGSFYNGYHVDPVQDPLAIMVSPVDLKCDLSVREGYSSLLSLIHI